MAWCAALNPCKTKLLEVLAPESLPGKGIISSKVMALSRGRPHPMTWQRGSTEVWLSCFYLEQLQRPLWN